ncbi:Long chain fatty acid CoA ligase 5 [Aduncisulcus paluster]|uniref:Ribonuclease n=1 Tax=Aduncisulcus paluster TaxID=2918883 RepID=A0ABQ5K5W0_9EUKA|nr:Long chain fatty acid CoA ligase 5 [Aduncisulcus paluster]
MSGEAHFPITSRFHQPSPEFKGLLPNLIRKSIKMYGKRTAFGVYRSFCLEGKRGSYEYITYSQFGSMVASLAAALRDLGIKKGDRVGVWSYNRVEWHVLDLACNCEGIVLVPLYDSQGLKEVEFVANNADIKMLFITVEVLSKFNSIYDKMPETLENVILFDDRPDDRALLVKHCLRLTTKTIATCPYTEEEVQDMEVRQGISFPPDKTFYKRMKEFTLPPPVKPLPDGSYSYQPQEHVAPTLTLSATESLVLLDHTFYKRMKEFTLPPPVKPLPDGSYSYPPQEHVAPTLTLSATESLVLLDHVTYGYHQLLSAGRKFLRRSGESLSLPRCPEDSKPDDLVSIVYTSGTGGDPKGVELTHTNLLAATYMFAPVVKRDLHGRIVILSFLPSAHIFQRAISMVVFRMGGCMCFFQGTAKTIMDDLFFTRPSVFVAVPRVFQKLFETVMKKLKKSGMIANLLFFKALNSLTKTKYVLKKEKPSSKMEFVFGAIRSLLGNRCQQIISGSAPLSPRVAEFVGCVMGCELVEGWGATETTAAGIVQTCPCRTYGNCGKPLGDFQVKLVDVPELEYVTDAPIPRGELCVKGANVFTRYWKNPEKTAESFDKDGFYHTGDIAQFIDGYIQIIDRKKCVYKLSQGEFVSAEALERAYTSSSLVSTAFMYGNRYESFVLAVLQIDEKEVREQIVSEGVLSADDLSELESMEDLCKEPKVISFVHKSVTEACREAKLRSFEIPRAIILEWDEWTIDNRCITPSFKIRRPFLRSKYERRLIDIYSRIKSAIKPGHRLSTIMAANLVCASLALGDMGAASVTSGETALNITAGLILFVLFSSFSFIFASNFVADDYFPIYASYVFRHGDRTPIYPLAPSKEVSTHWQDMQGNRSAGQLTDNPGVEKAYAKGESFYNALVAEENPYALLPTSYNFSTIQFQATDCDRTLMTGYSIIASMYPADDDSQSSIPGNSQAIPIQSVESTKDPLLRPFNTCNKLIALHNSLNEIEPLWAEYEDRKADLDSVSTKIGVACNGPQDVQHVYDPLNCDQSHYGSLPDSVTMDEFGTVVEMFNVVESYEFTTEDPYYQMYSCTFLRELRDHIQSLFDNNIPTADAHFYFGHDSTLMSLRAGLGVVNESIPEYVSNLSYEVMVEKTSPYRASWVADRVSVQNADMRHFVLRFVFANNSESYTGDAYASPYLDEYIKNNKLSNTLLDGTSLPTGYYRLDIFMSYVNDEVWDEDTFWKECGNVDTSLKWYWGMILGMVIVGVIFTIVLVTYYNTGERKSTKRRDDYFNATQGSVDQGDHLLVLFMGITIGIDETGRGPVLGPMVYAAAWMPSSELDILKKIKVDDSKQLSVKKRCEIRANMQKVKSLHILPSIITAETLSYKMLGLSHELFMGITIGIDETGRGPVLGPMVYAAAWMPSSELDILKKIKVDDSKQLSVKKRCEIRANMQKVKSLHILPSIITAETLSYKMLGLSHESLNEISHDAAINLVHTIHQTEKEIDSLYVDTVGKPEKYRDILRRRLPFIPNIVVEAKADGTYPIVGAASIFAKFLRDRIVEGEAKVRGLDKSLKKRRSSASARVGACDEQQSFPGVDVTQEMGDPDIPSEDSGSDDHEGTGMGVDGVMHGVMDGDVDCDGSIPSVLLTSREKSEHYIASRHTCSQFDDTIIESLQHVNFTESITPHDLPSISSYLSPSQTLPESFLAFGSGYPGGSTTKAWIRRHIHNVFGFPSVVRFSWKTTRTLLQDSTGGSQDGSTGKRRHIIKVEWESDEILESDSSYRKKRMEEVQDHVKDLRSQNCASLDASRDVRGFGDRIKWL